ncbi:condensation domain-containing protein, partial [Granulicella aggregans]|uniref:condensation domain-containing protein n=1 Tax=Granulicella aggregans TaxID=474949 RepID=UPI001FE8794F
MLKLDRVGRHDNFFALGGHSLLAIRMIAQIQARLKIDVNVGEIFTHSTIKDFAQSLKKNDLPVLLPIRRIDRNQPIPLSFAQQRLWFISQIESAGRSYHIPFYLRLQGDLNRNALRWALDTVLARHEALRTTFYVEAGTPFQRIQPWETLNFKISETDLRDHPDPESSVRAVLQREADGRFDLERGPLVRAHLILADNDETLLAVTMHHIVSDGWSMGIFRDEFISLYNAYIRGEQSPLPSLAIQYADYAVWQRHWLEGERLQEQSEYWRIALAGAPSLLQLPTDYPRPAEQSYAGAFRTIFLDGDLTQKLKIVSSRHDTTLFMTLFAAWFLLLSRLAGQEDLVVGTPTANRGRPELDPLIGFFVNTLPVRLDLAGSPTVSDLLKRVKTQILAALRNQDIPFEQMVEVLRPIRSMAHTPLFQVMFAWEQMSQTMSALDGVAHQSGPAIHHTTSKFDLSLHLNESEGMISGGIEYATALFDPAT